MTDTSAAPAAPSPLSTLDPATLAKMPKDTWFYRRWVVMGSLLWMAGLMSFIIIRNSENSLNSEAFMLMSGSFVGIVFAYVFGAIWDDHSRRIFGGDHGDR